MLGTSMRGKISDKNASVILNLLKESGDIQDVIILDILSKAVDKDWVVAEAISFLESKENIFYLLEERNILSESIVEAAMKAMDSDADIIKILAKLEFSQNFCIIGFPLLKIKEKTPAQIVRLMKMAEFNRGFCFQMVQYLSSVKKAAFLLDIFEESGRRKDIGELIIPYLDSKRSISYVLEETEFDSSVLKKVPSEYLDAEELLQALFKKKNRESGDVGLIWGKKIAPLLDLPQKEDHEILALIKRAEKELKKSSWPMCEHLASHLKDPEKLWSMVHKFKFGSSFLKEVILYLDSSRAFEAMDKNGYDVHVCQIGIRRAENENQAVDILKKIKYHHYTFPKPAPYHPSVFSEAFPLLSPPNILHGLRENNFDCGLFKKALPYLNLDESEVLDLIRENHDSNISEMLVRLLDLSNRSREDMARLIQESGRDVFVCEHVAEQLRPVEETT